MRALDPWPLIGRFIRSAPHSVLHRLLPDLTRQMALFGLKSCYFTILLLPSGNSRQQKVASGTMGGPERDYAIEHKALD